MKSLLAIITLLKILLIKKLYVIGSLTIGERFAPQTVGIWYFTFFLGYF